MPRLVGGHQPPRAAAGQRGTCHLVYYIGGRRRRLQSKEGKESARGGS